MPMYIWGILTVIEPQIGADFCTGNTRIADVAAPAGKVYSTLRTRPFTVLRFLICFTVVPVQFLRMKLLDNLLKEQRCRHLKERRDCLGIAMAKEKGPLRDWLQALRLWQCYRFCCDHDLCGNLSWANRLKRLQGIVPVIPYQYKGPSTSPIDLDLKPPNIQLSDDYEPIHMDLKPGNILLDDDYESMVTNFGMTRLPQGSQDTRVPMESASGTHNSPWYVEFAVAASAEGVTQIMIGSHVIHVPKYLSAHHSLVQMVLFARNKSADTFACFKSMVPKGVFDMAKSLSSSVLSNWWKTDWSSARPKSESPKVGTVFDFNTGESIGRRNELTDNESHPSDTDASGAAWVAATAAPHHATGNLHLLSGFIMEHDDQFVHAVDGVPRKVLARGAVITDSMVLPDVWFVPGLTENLVSVSQLVELDHSVGFSCGECCIRGADGKVVGKGHLQEGGHYMLDFLKVPLAI